uniref:Uncharacterized protein n=1 Tax=Oryza glumipatula TaxID=40148 RepID=A0A0E0BBG0_9ORYZ
MSAAAAGGGGGRGHVGRSLQVALADKLDIVKSLGIIGGYPDVIIHFTLEMSLVLRPRRAAPVSAFPALPPPDTCNNGNAPRKLWGLVWCVTCSSPLRILSSGRGYASTVAR